MLASNLSKNVAGYLITFPGRGKKDIRFTVASDEGKLHHHRALLIQRVS